MFRRNLLTLAAVTFAAALAACATSKPMTSVGALAYPAAQSQSANPANARFAAGTAAQPSGASSADADRSTNDPMFRLDMP